MRRNHSFVLIIVLLACMRDASSTAAAQTMAAVPTTIIYPREIIRDEMLADRAMPQNAASGGEFMKRGNLIGKVARATLLPGQPIQPGSIEEPRLVAIGAQVKIVFASDGLTIVAFGAALQNGVAGDFVRVRNGDSGLVVTGVVRSDGSVQVGTN